MMMEKRRNTENSGALAAFSTGLLMSIISGTTHSFNSGIFKYMRDMPPWQYALYCYWGSLSFVLPLAIWSGENLLGPPNVRKRIFTRSALSTTSIVLLFVVIRYLPLGEGIVLYGSTPVFVAVGARIFLKEALTLLHVISLITTIAGITLITGLYQVIIEGSRKYTTDDVYGLTAAFACVICLAVQIIITRQIKHVNQFVLILNSSVVSVLGLSIFTAGVSGFHAHGRGLEQGFIICGGILGFVSQIGIIASLKFMEAGPVSIIRISSSVAVGFLLQIFVFGDRTDPITVTGAVLVGFSILLLGLKKYISSVIPGRGSYVVKKK